MESELYPLQMVLVLWAQIADHRGHYVTLNDPHRNEVDMVSQLITSTEDTALVGAQDVGVGVA